MNSGACHLYELHSNWHMFTLINHEDFMWGKNHALVDIELLPVIYQIELNE